MYLFSKCQFKYLHFNNNYTRLYYLIDYIHWISEMREILQKCLTKEHSPKYYLFIVAYYLQIVLEAQKAQYEETLGYLMGDKKNLEGQCERLRRELEKFSTKVLHEFFLSIFSLLLFSISSSFFIIVIFVLIYKKGFGFKFW